MHLRLFQLAFLLVVSSCIQFEKKDLVTKPSEASKTEKVQNGIVKAYYKDGSVRAEINYKDGKREGVAKEYYPTGVLFREIEYKSGKKEGMSKRYYKTGEIYQQTPYANDTIHGVQKKYRENGKLISEAPYHNGDACSGLVEYTTDGKVKKKYPTIIVTPINTLLKNGQYILRLSLSDKSKKVEFFEGKINSKGCPEIRDFIYTSSKGIADIEFFLPQGGFMMQELNFIARVKTLQGNYYITQKKYNMAIENP